MASRTFQSQITWCVRAQWTLTLVMVGLLAAYAILGWWPANRRLSTLRAEIATRSQRLDSNTARTSNLPKLANEVEFLRLKLERFDKKLPKTPAVEDFIAETAQVSGQQGIKKLMHQPGVMRRTDLYGETPIAMSFESDFTGAFNFIRQLEEAQRLARVKTLKVRAKDAKLGLVDVNLVMNTYFSEQ
jgi:Tfp pilus assembly protein PilO